VDVGGGLVPPERPVAISPAGYMTGRVLLRSGGRTIPARIVPEGVNVSVTPQVDVNVSFSGDGRYVFVRPSQMLDPNTRYTVSVTGLVTTGGPRLGNVTLGPGGLEPYVGTFTVQTGGDGKAWDSTTDPGLSLSRLAVPLPPMLPSVNQIGFDFYDWIGGAVPTRGEDTVVWFVGAKRDAEGEIVADPSARFAFPVHGQQRGGTFEFNASGVNLWFTFGPVPLQRFDLRGTFGPDGQVEPTSQFLAEAVCADIPSYGALMPATGMCDTAGVLTAAGTFLGGTADSPAVQKVPGLQVGAVTYDNGVVSADINAPAGYTTDNHYVSILLIDADGKPVPLDYWANTTIRSEPDGRISGVDVAAPGLSDITAIVMTDAFPAKTVEIP
jgi:hypothetical protein